MTEADSSRSHARAAALATIALPDQDGNLVTLGGVWRERPVALVWLRHYG